jgi:hypothetical protein
MLWNTRFSWDRFDEPHDKEYGDIDPNLPFTGPYQLTGPPFPQINIGGFEGMFPRTFRRPRNDAYSLLSNLSRTMGTHFVRLGGEYRAYQFPARRSEHERRVRLTAIHAARSLSGSGAIRQRIRELPARTAGERLVSVNTRASSALLRDISPGRLEARR